MDSGSHQAKSDLNGASNQQGALRIGGSKFVPQMKRSNRRALGNIDQNILGATLQPCVITKRESSGKDAICMKNPENLAYIPTRRNFAGEMEIEKPTTLASNLSGHEDCKIEDVGEFRDVIDASTPMFVKHTEAILDEIDEIVCEEIEMEDAMEDDLVLDIDGSDIENPLAVVEYIDDIYHFYRKTESLSCVSPAYMSFQFDINQKMRAILIDWLIEVHYKFELMDETLFLTVNLIDRFLERQTVSRKKLQLVGMTAMLLACKYEEVCVPIVEDLIVICDKAYTRTEVLDMEKVMVNTLQFNMSVPTPYVFMRRFLKAAQSDRKLELLSFYIIELCLVEYEMLKFPPSLLAAAAVYTAQCSLLKSNQWSKTSEWHTTYSEDQLMECSRMMVTFHQKAGTGKLTGVHRKYSTHKFGYAARSEPAQFLL